MGAQEAVQHNVDHLLELFHRVREQKEKKATYFRTWVDPTTGELQFVEEGKRKPFKGKRWQEVHAVVAYDPTSDQLSWREENPAAIDFSLQALNIFQETICALKAASVQTQLADYLIINRIWHPSSRYLAEEMLLSHPVGTFLFRKDPFAALLENKLQKKHPQESLSLWTVSVLRQDQLCSDYTLVHTKKGWQLYNDDIHLEQECFATLEQLLGRYKHLFRYPLYR